MGKNTTWRIYPLRLQKIADASSKIQVPLPLVLLLQLTALLGQALVGHHQYDLKANKEGGSWGAHYMEVG